MDRRDDSKGAVFWICGVCGCIFITALLIWIIVLTVEFNHLHHELKDLGVLDPPIIEAGIAAAGSAAGAVGLAAAARAQNAAGGGVKPQVASVSAQQAAQARVASRWADIKKN